MPTKPVLNGYISSTFEQHKARANGVCSLGIDIGTKQKDPVQVVCALESVVVTYGYSPTFGYRVWTKITKGQFAGLYNIYGHLLSVDSSILSGKTIKEGAKIGIMGNTGLMLLGGQLIENKRTLNGFKIAMPNGRHLHYEIRTTCDISGISVEPTIISELFS